MKAPLCMACGWLCPGLALAAWAGMMALSPQECPHGALQAASLSELSARDTVMWIPISRERGERSHTV